MITPDREGTRVLGLGLKNKDFLTIHDFTPRQVGDLLDLAAELKAMQKARRPHPVLAGRSIGMVFLKTSTRTRVSFEVGIHQLGAQPLFLSSADIQLKVGETIKDTGHVLSRYLDCIMIRAFAHRDIEELAEAASVPVINGLTDEYHPCQGMADILTIREHCGELGRCHIVYVGDGNNVAHSLLVGGVKMGAHVTVCTPPDYKPMEHVMQWAREDAKLTGGSVDWTDDITCVKDCDIVYTDTWAGMGLEAEHEKRVAALNEWQVNSKLLKMAGPQARVMHCLPAHWGEEITEEVIYSPQSIMFDQAENRMHAQKAIMAAIVP